MTDRYSKQALLRDNLKLQKRVAQLEGIINAMVAAAGRVFISQEDHDRAQLGRVSIRFDPGRKGLVLQFFGEPGARPKGVFSKLVALVGGASLASKPDDGGGGAAGDG